MNGKLWTEAEDARMCEIFPHHSSKQVAAMLGRTVSGVNVHAAKLGLRKTSEYLASPDACRLRRGDNVGAAFRYPKGHIPANAGTRRPGWAPGRMAETQFKKGQRTGSARHNYMPLGSTRLIDGYVDKNRLNIVLENLELITRAELMRRNTIHNLPPQLKETIQLAGRLKRRIRKHEKQIERPTESSVRDNRKIKGRRSADVCG